MRECGVLHAMPQQMLRDAEEKRITAMRILEQARPFARALGPVLASSGLGRKSTADHALDYGVIAVEDGRREGQLPSPVCFLPSPREARH